MESRSYIKNSECPLQEQINHKLVQIFDDEGIEDPTVEVIQCTGKGDNFMGVLYRITAIDGSKKLNLICKTEPFSETRRRETRTGMMFKREIFVYQDLLPLYKKFQLEKDVSGTSFFDNHPKLYGADPGYLLMSDLCSEGFKMCDRAETLDNDHLKLAIEALAKFHAVGYALKNQRSRCFKKLTDQMKEDYFGKPIDVSLCSYTRAMLVLAIDTLDDHEEEMKIKVRELVKNIEVALPKYLDAQDAEPYSVICHGDCWSNNIMYKYCENGKPENARLLDFQQCRYGSPALDLSYLIFCCTDAKLRKDHYEDILRLYHGTLSDALQLLGENPDKTLPREALENQMKGFGAFGLVMACIIIKMVLSTGDDIPDMDKLAGMMMEDKDHAKNIKFGFGNSERAYRSRLGDVIRDVIRLGML